MGIIAVSIRHIEQRGKRYRVSLSMPRKLWRPGVPKVFREPIDARDIGNPTKVQAALARLQTTMDSLIRAKTPAMDARISEALKAVESRVIAAGTIVPDPVLTRLVQFNSQIIASPFHMVTSCTTSTTDGPPPSPTFEQAAADYVRNKGTGWKQDLWTPALRRHAFKRIGHLPVNEITTADLLAILRPLWTAKHETGLKIRGRIEAILSYATTHGWRTGPNPAAWTDHLENVLPRNNQLPDAGDNHHAKSSTEELPAIYRMAADKANSANDPVTRAGWRALLFAFLTVGRTDEVLGATWDEIDLGEGTWSLPGSRMKEGRPHVVALSTHAIELLRSLPHRDGCLFRGKDGRLGHATLWKKLRSVPGCGGLTVHGVTRGGFGTWRQERTTYPAELAEAALAHLVGDRVARAYSRSDMLARRRPLMQAWADFLGGTN